MNLAARLEPLCEPMEIMISHDTQKLIKSEFRTTDRGEHEIRGFGKMRVFRLDGDFTAANDSASF